ncbi:MAG TPA: hypothetical protein DCZ91_17205, partial [Lachnospiraceae bacterium]|nr:hypothetical protein [Lachnospiraceae bacterium]
KRIFLNSLLISLKFSGCFVLHGASFPKMTYFLPICSFSCEVCSCIIISNRTGKAMKNSSGKTSGENRREK